MFLVGIIAAAVLPTLCVADMFESKEHSLTAPIVVSEKDNREIDWWRLVPKATVENDDKVILLKEKGIGGIWNLKPLPTKQWQVQLRLQIPRDISTTGAMALWFVKEVLISGPIYGYRDYFNGFGIVIIPQDEKKHFDTSNQQHRGNLEVYLITNNGSVSYYRLKREKRKIPSLTFCTIDQDPAAAFTNVSLRILNSGDAVTVWIGTNDTPEVKCLETREIIPDNYFVGLTAMEQQNDKAVFVLNQVHVSVWPTENTDNDVKPSLISAVAVVLIMFVLGWTAIQIGK